jgi:AraC family transcriptional regulator
MDWVKNIVESLKIIEDELYTESLSANTISNQLFMSTAHYQRAFSILTGITVSEYIRNRRLSLAALALLQNDQKVLDTALNYGYETPEAFAKAFKRFHGVTPSDVKKGQVQLKAYPPLRLQIILKGEDAMNYTIVEKPSFKLIGKGIEVSNENGENFIEIPKFWGTCHQNGFVKQLCALKNFKELVGACIMPSGDAACKQFTYAIAAIAEQTPNQADFDTWDVPASTWAIFESIGPMPNAIQETWHRIFAEWFPATGFEHADAPELEVYPEGDSSSADYRCEIWIPIIKK